MAMAGKPLQRCTSRRGMSPTVSYGLVWVAAGEAGGTQAWMAPARRLIEGNHVHGTTAVEVTQ